MPAPALDSDLPPGHFRTGRPRRVVLGIAAGLALLLAAFAGVVYLGIVRATEAPVARVLAFLERTRQGDLDGARAHLAQAYREEVTRERLAAMIAAHPAPFGAVDATFRDRKIKGDLCVLRGSVTNADGAVEPAEFELLREGPDWRIAYWKWSLTPREGRRRR